MNPKIRNTLPSLVLFVSGCASTHGLQPAANLRAGRPCP
jgi:hypothetical protein